MDMRQKVFLGIFLVCVGLGISIFFTSFWATNETQRAIVAADQFISDFYTRGEDITAARQLLSNGFRALESEPMTRKLRDSLIQLVGNYQIHSNPEDVTRALEPGAPDNLRLIKFDVAYEKDPDARIIMTMIREGNRWKVHGFNVDSPTIREAQIKGSFLSPNSDKAESQTS